MPLLPPRLSASRHSHLYLRCSWRRDPTTPPAVVPSRRLPPLPRGSPQTTAADSSGPAAAPPRPRTATRPAAAVAASATDRARLRRWPRPCPASCVQPPTSCDGIGCPTPASACLPFALPHSVPCAPGLLPGHPLRLVSSSGGRQDRSVTSAIGEIFLFCRLLSLSRPASPRARGGRPASPASFLHVDFRRRLQRPGCCASASAHRYPSGGSSGCLRHRSCAPPSLAPPLPSLLRAATDKL